MRDFDCMHFSGKEIWKSFDHVSGATEFACNSQPMNGANRLRVTDVPVEVQDFRELTHHLREFIEYTPIQ